MTQRPRGKARIRQFYAERGSSAQAESTQQQEKPSTDHPARRGKDRIRAMYNKPPSEAGGAS